MRVIGRLDWFLCALVGTVLLAAIYPPPGITGGPLRMDLIARYGVAIVFFLYGLTLAPERMRAGLSNWRLHVLVQCATFLLFPAITLTAAPLMRPYLPTGVAIGFFYLAVLPSTVSSSVAMTSLARGNVPAAIFNASLSSLIGVFATPALMAWYMHQGGGALTLGPVFAKIFLLVIVPMLIGQALHRPLLGLSTRHSALIKVADRLIVLAIVYNSFCDSVAEGIWSTYGVGLLGKIAGGCVALFAIIYVLISLISRLLRFNRADGIAATFCGSKKSLATGAPLANIMFGAGPATGLILTPVILFHFLQLVIVSIVASRLSQVGDNGTLSPAKG